MPTLPLTLEVPEALYQRLKKHADATRRTVEGAALDVLATAMPVADELPADLEEALSPLALFDDAALWRAARTHLPAEDASRLEELHLKKQREPLTDAESGEAARLIRRYERAMLVRAQAAALLHQRGHDVSVLRSSS